MKRRLYFLFPDAQHAGIVVDELERYGIDRRFMHTIAGKGGDPGRLPVATQNQKLDLGARIERFLWGGNLALFFTALFAVFAILLMRVEWYWLLLPIGLMLISFLMGLEFATHVPNVHLSEFHDAMRHHEILLMIDVPVWRTARVEQLVKKYHPEAVAGGVGWCADTLRV